MDLPNTGNSSSVADVIWNVVKSGGGVGTDDQRISRTRQRTVAPELSARAQQRRREIRPRASGGASGGIQQDVCIVLVTKRAQRAALVLQVDPDDFCAEYAPRYGPGQMAYGTRHARYHHDVSGPYACRAEAHQCCRPRA